jgi:hypothetical protein
VEEQEIEATGDQGGQLHPEARAKGKDERQDEQQVGRTIPDNINVDRRPAGFDL